MVRLDQTVRTGIKKLEREVEKKLRDAKRNETLRMWKDKKIVSVEQWEKLAADGHKQLEYMPEDFVECQFFFYPDDKELKEKRTKWYQDYVEFLESEKNPTFGKYKCRDCILNQFSEIRTKSIRDVILKCINADKKFPCEVVNMFNCPYEQGSKNYTLLYFGYMWKIVDDALHHAHNLTYSENSKKFEVDFEADKVYEYYSWVVERPPDYTIDEAFSDFRISKIPIMDRKDIYNGRKGL